MKVKIDELRRGDVLLNKKHHTAIYIGDGKIAHASINEKGGTIGGKEGDQTGREICTRDYYEPTYKDGNNGWDAVLRPASAEIGDKASTMAEQIASDDSHGYDQIKRWGPDFDCSSLVIEIYEELGVPVKTRGATYTGNMFGVFKKCGFTEVKFTDTPQTAPQTPQDAPNTSDGSIYVVKKGDTLGVISARFGVSVADMVKANPFIKDPDKIYVGDKLRIPTKSEAITYAGKVRTFHGSPLNIRAGQGINYVKIGTLANGSAVTTTSKTGEWLKLADRPGFVSSKYIIF